MHVQRLETCVGALPRACLGVRVVCTNHSTESAARVYRSGSTSTSTSAVRGRGSERERRNHSLARASANLAKGTPERRRPSDQSDRGGRELRAPQGDTRVTDRFRASLFRSKIRERGSREIRIFSVAGGLSLEQELLNGNCTGLCFVEFRGKDRSHLLPVLTV